MVRPTLGDLIQSVKVHLVAISRLLLVYHRAPCRTVSLFVLYQRHCRWAEVNTALVCRWYSVPCYLTVKSEQDARIFQEDLDKITIWEQTWKIEFHRDKCEIISITRKQKPLSYPCTLYRQHAAESRHHVLCGGINTDYIMSKANSTLGFLHRNINVSNPQLKGEAIWLLYVQILTLEYSQTVWDLYTAGAVDMLESVQRRAARYTLNRHRRTSSVNAISSELRWQPLAELKGADSLDELYFTRSLQTGLSYHTSDIEVAF